MKNKTPKSLFENLSIFCWNIGNPSLQRASRQALWLRQRPEDILVLTETKRSEGCLFFERYFRAYGYNVVFPKPEGNELGVMVISKHVLTPTNFSNHVNYLQARAVSAKLDLISGELEIIGIYVPSRDSSHEKIDRKRRFLKNLTGAFETAPRISTRIFCGDLNILESNHVPHYSFFEAWEYDFYENLGKYQLKDAFRHLNSSAQEYSWVGRTGDGYRYDHCFVSDRLLSSLERSYYLHEPRKTRLSDHSALVTELKIAL